MYYFCLFQHTRRLPRILTNHRLPVVLFHIRLSGTVITHNLNQDCMALDLKSLQAGLVGVLVKRFRMAILVTLLYIGLSIAFHVWSLHVRWDNPASYWWTDGLLALFVIQRFCE
jgi:hypothetical protein